MRRLPKRPPKPVRVWVKYLRNGFKAERGPVPADDQLLYLAGAITTVGPPDSTEGQEAYWAIIALFSGRMRQSRWPVSIQIIREAIERFPRVVESVHAYQKYTGRDVKNDNFRLDRVLRVMLDIPGPKVYVESFPKEGWKVGQVFHRGTFNSKKKRLRGMFSYSEGEGHGEQVKRKVRVVE